MHDLIEFDTSDFEQMIWSAIDSDEFQRLRRIKQLGFSELVYPGASHTRFIHCIGVFHTSRQLSSHVKHILGSEFDEHRAQVSMAAALVHDLGHGPFSHAFEDAIKEIDRNKLRKTKKHELWTGDIISGDTSVGNVIETNFGSSFRSDVASLLTTEPRDIYSSIVSSQFDADRLDYIRRDRLMTGTQHGGFDYSWLLANLEVDTITLSTDNERFAEVQSLVLGNKALQAAEAYVLGLFQMYFAVYFHKATRSAEKMLTAILCHLGDLCEREEWESVGLPENNPLVAFLRERSLKTYLALDDFVIWAALGVISSSSDSECAHLAQRLRSRKLYKAIDVGTAFAGRDDSVVRFKAALKKAKDSNEIDKFSVFEDEPSRDPYKRRGYEGMEALQKVLIRREDGSSYEDLSNRSEVVKALSKKSVYRVYVRDAEAKEKIWKMIEGMKNGQRP
ncbi:HD domain-containing protein [Xanthobacter sp. NM-25]|uniref:HD domain-containing protein n=2 Tax=unclassified Xanthobacter TaxID=2623496 RepID=UPI001EDD6848|nr:HD domain-containing protein [Xanthobacter sp. NM-25]